MENTRAPFAGENDQRPKRIGLVELFLLFSRLGLTSFGGSVSAWMHWAFVEQRPLIGETEFASALALGRLLPGANVVNLSILIGQRLHGFPGALAAVLGIVVGPSLAAIVLATLYQQFSGSVTVESLLEGAAAAAVGMLIAMGLQSGARIISSSTASRRQVAQSIGATAVLVAMFLFVGVLRFPMVPVVGCLAPLSVALAFFARGKTVDGDG